MIPYDRSMQCTPRRNRKLLLGMIFSMVVLIFLTRVLTLTHNRELHPDEYVFYNSTYSLLSSILHPGTEYTEIKEYPEAAYCFQLPFQFVGEIARKLLGIEGTKGLQHLGRLASVAYFIVATGLGMRLLWKYLGKSSVSLIIYGLTMCFSLFFVEQSRYGTGDMVSLMLLMLLLNLTAQALESEKDCPWWAAAFFVCGILGAVKYPLLVFALIPLTAFLSKTCSRKPMKLLFLLLACLCGFFLFSPKALEDPSYILRVIQREGNAYMGTINARIPINNLLTILLYALFYSDFPLLPVLALGGLAATLARFLVFRKTAALCTGTTLLFQVIIPGVCLIFLGYNLFVALLFFRTYTPFFGILTLYTAVTAETLFSKNRWGRIMILLLAGFMVLRGSVLIWVMASDSNAPERLETMVSSSVDENWAQTWYTCLFAFHLPDETGTLDNESHFIDALIAHNNSTQIQAGQLVITGAYEYYLGYETLLRGDNHQTRQWNAFKNSNQDYFVGQVYPDWYYSLFGAWIQGSTLSQYEFPCHYIYYRSE